MGLKTGDEVEKHNEKIEYSILKQGSLWTNNTSVPQTEGFNSPSLCPPKNIHIYKSHCV